MSSTEMTFIFRIFRNKTTYINTHRIGESLKHRACLFFCLLLFHQYFVETSIYRHILSHIWNPRANRETLTQYSVLY